MPQELQMQPLYRCYQAPQPRLDLRVSQSHRQQLHAQNVVPNIKKPHRIFFFG